MDIFPGTCVTTWISLTVTLIGNHCQYPWSVLRLVGKTCSCAYTWVDSACTGSCENFWPHVPWSDAASILGQICPLLIVRGSKLWGWWVSYTFHWLDRALSWVKSCSCNIHGTHPCQILLGNQSYQKIRGDKRWVCQSRYNMCFFRNAN